jgi:hypothetical protein
MTIPILNDKIFIMNIEESFEIELHSIDQDPDIIRRNIKLAKERILRALEECMTVEVNNIIKDGRPIKQINVTFEVS